MGLNSIHGSYIYICAVFQVKTAKLVAILDVGFLGAVIAVTLLAFHGTMRLTFVGIICAGLTIGMYASPLSVIVSFLTKLTDCKPLKSIQYK